MVIFINGDWSKLIGIEYVKYDGVDYDNMEIDLSQYVKDAINRLKKSPFNKRYMNLEDGI